MNNSVEKNPNTLRSQDLTFIAQHELSLGREVKDLLGLEVFPGVSPVGKETLNDFSNTVIEGIIKYPELPHIVIGFGKPGSGKTAFLHEYLDEITTRDKRLISFLKDTGKRFEFIYMPWGDPFLLLSESEKKIEGIPYHADPELREEKLREIGIVEDVLVRSFNESLKEEYDKDVIRVIFSDIPLITGLYKDIDKEEGIIGIPRGLKLLKKLISERQSDGNINYTLNGIGLVAIPEINQLASKTRGLLLSQNTPEDLKQTAKEQGMMFTFENSEKLIAYKEEVAPPNEMDLVNLDIKEVILEMYKCGEFRERFPLNIPKSVDDLSGLGGEMIEMHIIGQKLMTKIIQDLGLDKQNVIILHNSMLHDAINIPMEIDHQRPIRGKLQR